MTYAGVIYRPPSEARSLIVQVTTGCSHNRCRFCTMYRDKEFKIRSMEDIRRDFCEAREQYGDQIEKVFLADGDALVLSGQRLMELLAFIRGLFPRLRSVTSYGTPKDILRHSPAELKLLRQEGLSMVYLGAESGDARVLRQMEKGATREEIIEAGQRLKSAGIQSSVTLISGLGGKERLSEHAIGSADLISRMNPDYVGFLTLMLEKGAPVLRDIEEGKLELLTPEGVVTEMELFLRNVNSEGTVFRANHASNYVMLKGTLNRDIPMMLNELDEVRREKLFRKENWRRL
ncbi:B12-binding domain-containing radical SAM protein [Caproicibacter fermentans]|uniref:Radical SAM protein n=1 Tax=Caproicibacter fermentans TaxID=2576756 RepID=A0A7G8TB68_9FIRM|nr:radical SAM protein [Caproicibacter fermentans]QNK40859.1 radical SAM protein [Caproicibacter fermentans]